MAEYKYGTYGTITDSIVQQSAEAASALVYVGTAPVGFVKNNTAAVNTPIVLGSLADAEEFIGYSSDWKSYTLCEAVAAHFENTLGNIGPIIVINVLDPAIHKKSTTKTINVTFTNGFARFESDTIVMDTLALDDLAEGTDYTSRYSKGNVILTAITELDGEPIEATYIEMDPLAVTTADIIGEATNEGHYKGIGSIQLVYPNTGRITNVIAAPGWSEKPDVYKALVNATSKINDHWDAYAIADIPIKDGNTAIDTIAKANAWKTANAYNSGFSKVCWPCGLDALSGSIFHLSTLTAWAILRTDAEHGGIPSETPGNTQIPIDSLYFGDASTNLGYDRRGANTLTERGITTAIFWGGTYKLWGDHTAAYNISNTELDPKFYFDANIRMLMHITNSFQVEWSPAIDEPMNRALIDTILNREGEKLDLLVAQGAVIGEPRVQFIPAQNSLGDIMQGQFRFDVAATPAPPAKALSVFVAFTDEGFSSLYGEE
jgi:phage tail sheath protein FI